ncbi:MAG: galactosyltransferase-related protein [Pseudomonadota bacterium]|nr:galactosyltransferase-related protein [Pseudomonadota bacterium]
MLSIVVVSHGHERFFDAQIASILEHCEVKFQLIVVDNLNDGGFFRERLSSMGVDYIVSSNVRTKSFSENNNFGVSLAVYDNILILNPDTYFIDDSVFSYVANHGVSDGLFFPTLLNTDLTVQSSSRAKPNLFSQVFRLIMKRAFNREMIANGDYWFFGAAILCKKSFFYQVGGFDENFPMYAEDAELCDRVRKLNYAVEQLETVRLVHHLGGEAKARYLKKAIISNIYYRYKSALNSCRRIRRLYRDKAE